MKKILTGILLLVGAIVILLAGLVVAGGSMSPLEYQEALWDLKQIPDEQYQLSVANKNQAAEERRLAREARDRKLAIDSTKKGQDLFEHHSTKTTVEEIGIRKLTSDPMPTLLGNTAYNLVAMDGTLVAVAIGDNLEKGDEVIVYRRKGGFHYALTPSEVLAKN